MDVDRPTNTISRADVERAALHRLRAAFPDIELTEALLKEVFQHAIELKHDDPTQSIQVWNGRATCRPDVGERLMPENGFVTLNSWKTPPYRTLGVAEADSALLDEFLEWTFSHEPDRRVFKDWLAWCLQNEADKPGWSIFLYSKKKGTGKSTLAELVSRLFRADNCFTQNGVSKLTGQFNMTLLSSKLVISEEVQLKQGTSQSNTLKTYITECETTAEFKGKEAQRVRQCCCFLFTSNHMPMWIEADDRRYYVIGMDHDGHAAGQKADDFGGFVARWREDIENDEAIARVYNALLHHQVAEGFNPKSLNLATQSNPLMESIQAASGDVLVDRVDACLNASGQRAIPQEDLIAVFQTDFRVNADRIRHVMTELGWRHNNAKWGGKDYRRVLWVHPDFWVDRGRVKGPDGYDEAIADRDPGMLLRQ